MSRYLCILFFSYSTICLCLMNKRQEQRNKIIAVIINQNAQNILRICFICIRIRINDIIYVNLFHCTFFCGHTCTSLFCVIKGFLIIVFDEL